MTIGTAIFLSAVVFALVALFGLTRDRWSWRKIIKVALVFVASVCLCIGTVVTYLRWPERLQPVSEYFGVTLGMQMKEITYIKGYPANVYGVEESIPGGIDLPPLPAGRWELVIPVKDIPKDKTKFVITQNGLGRTLAID
jgi:hypothetical protein